MSPKTKFNLLLEPEQLAALRDIQAVTGATVAEQIRRAIADWIAARHVPPGDTITEDIRNLAGTHLPPEAPLAKRKMLRSVQASAKSLTRTAIKERELEAIQRGERSGREIDRFVKKNTRKR